MRVDTTGPMQRATGLYLALHLGPLVVDETVLWGVDGLVYLPAWVTVAFVALSAALLVRSSTEVVDRWMLRIDPWQTPQKAAKSTVIVITLFLAVSYLLEVATPLLGDGMLRLSVRPENLSGTTDDRSLLVTQLALGLSGLDPATVGYGMLSRLAGVAFVVLSFLAARDFVAAAVGRVAIVGAFAHLWLCSPILRLHRKLCTPLSRIARVPHRGRPQCAGRICPSSCCSSWGPGVIAPGHGRPVAVSCSDRCAPPCRQRASRIG